jgi:hypothetical protein
LFYWSIINNPNLAACPTAFNTAIDVNDWLIGEIERLVIGKEFCLYPSPKG